MSRLRACGPEFPEYLRYGRKGTGRSTDGAVTAHGPLR